MDPQKEQWINTVLGSLDGVQPVEPNPFLFTKIHNRLTINSQPASVPVHKVWLAALSFGLLVLVNGWLTWNTSAPARADTGALNAVITDMQLYPTNTQPYELWSGQNY